MAGRDVVVMLLTSSGILLCYAALPFLFDSLRSQSVFPSIIVASSPISVHSEEIHGKGITGSFT